MASYINIPEELRCQIAGYLGIQDLRRLKDTCKTLRPSAMRELLSMVRAYPSKKKIKRYNGILADPVLKQYVRHLEISTIGPRADNQERQGDKWEGAKLDDTTRQAYNAFSGFPNLTSVSLRFSKNGSSGSKEPLGYHPDPGSSHPTGSFRPWPFSQYRESFGLRQPVLQDFFRTLNHPDSKVGDICIDNLQNINDVAFMASAPVTNVLSRIHALRLFIVTEHQHNPTKMNMYLKETHIFMKELRPLWLQPAASNLTTLVLYHSIPFGYLPKLDLRGLEFPNLQTLALGNYTFSHDWQLDWLSSCSPVLKNLFLDNPIVVFYRVHEDFLEDSDGYPDFPLPQRPATEYVPPRYKFINLTWSRIFEHLRNNLHTLRHFRIGRSSRTLGELRTPFSHANYDKMNIHLFQERYRQFNQLNTSGSSEAMVDYHWKRIYVGKPEINICSSNGKNTVEGAKAFEFLERFKEQDHEDRVALDALLETTGQLKSRCISLED
ncbi:hypothetical protein B0T16DRAFT_462880 [Cercophora newfieldiana]|uniref:F-box domain-containing protein n=1 Tax=Cercophora newfieldiana TaxID=92897 RepID=A0AA39XU64_9PEZI|nr:hypothetical protein B0T16DRAFT_462880 [Cercophora newfieldiana]